MNPLEQQQQGRESSSTDLKSQFPSPAQLRAVPSSAGAAGSPGIRTESSRTKHSPIFLFSCSNNPKQTPLEGEERKTSQQKQLLLGIIPPSCCRSSNSFSLCFVVLQTRSGLKDSAKWDIAHVERREKRSEHFQCSGNFWMCLQQLFGKICWCRISYPTFQSVIRINFGSSFSRFNCRQLFPSRRKWLGVFGWAISSCRSSTGRQGDDEVGFMHPKLQ